MAHWRLSRFTAQHGQALVDAGFLPPLTAAEEWRVPGPETTPQPPPGYVVSFKGFHERGFASPSHPFIRGLLHYYQIELQHLNPNGILHASLFVTLCEAFMRIDPHFALWRYYFAVSSPASRAGDPGPYPVGGASIHLRSNRARSYIEVVLPTSNRGWHDYWFYVKAADLPAYTGGVATPISEWGWGPAKREARDVDDLVRMVETLRAAGVNGYGLAAIFFHKGMPPLGIRAIRLGEAPRDQVTVLRLSQVVANENAVRARLSVAFGVTVHYPVDGHPVPWPQTGHPNVVSVSF